MKDEVSSRKQRAARATVVLTDAEKSAAPDPDATLNASIKTLAENIRDLTIVVSRQTIVLGSNNAAAAQRAATADAQLLALVERSTKALEEASFLKAGMADALRDMRVALESNVSTNRAVERELEAIRMGRAGEHTNGNAKKHTLSDNTKDGT